MTDSPVIEKIIALLLCESLVGRESIKSRELSWESVWLWLMVVGSRRNSMKLPKTCGSPNVTIEVVYRRRSEINQTHDKSADFLIVNIADICQSWHTTALFRPVKEHQKVRA